MFGRKKQQARVAESPQRIRISGADGALYDGAITALEIPEKLIIELSIEFFDDPEPCHIHRGAVLRRVFMELTMALGENSVTPVAELSETVRRYLTAYEGMTEVKMYRREGA